MYLVVFRSRKRADINHPAYDAQADRMEQLAAQQPGYLSFKSYAATDGETVAISEWVDEGAAKAWGRVAEHIVAQSDGRAQWYADYTMFACDDPRIHRFP
ncbi:MAG: antibiotic biosynthesis monooxygenase [Alteraurantiacibacter sp.]